MRWSTPIVARLGESATARAFVKGLVDFNGPASVGFNKYIKFMLPLLGIWLVIMLVVFVIAAI